LSVNGADDGNGDLIGPKLPIKIADVNRIIPRPASDE
jgi:hypothetical protein